MAEVAAVEKQIQETRTQLASEETKIAEAKQQLAKTPAPKLTYAQLKGLSRTQKQQYKGSLGVADKQRKVALKTLLSDEKVFKTEADKIRKQLSATQTQVNEYKAEVARVDKENAGWKYAQKMIRKGKAHLALRYDSPSIKRKVQELLKRGFQTYKQMDAGTYPKEYLATIKVKEPEMTIKRTEIPREIISIDREPVKIGTPVSVSKVTRDYIKRTGKTPLPTVTFKDLSPTIKTIDVSYGKAPSIEAPKYEQTITPDITDVSQSVSRPVINWQINEEGKLAYMGSQPGDTLRSVTQGKFFMDDGVIKESDTNREIALENFENIWKASSVRDTMRDLYGDDEQIELEEEYKGRKDKRKAEEIIIKDTDIDLNRFGNVDYKNIAESIPGGIRVTGVDDKGVVITDVPDNMTWASPTPIRSIGFKKQSEPKLTPAGKIISIPFVRAGKELESYRDTIKIAGGLGLLMGKSKIDEISSKIKKYKQVYDITAPIVSDSIVVVDKKIEDITGTSKLGLSIAKSKIDSTLGTAGGILISKIDRTVGTARKKTRDFVNTSKFGLSIAKSKIDSALGTARIGGEMLMDDTVQNVLKIKKMKKDIEQKGALLGAGLVYKGVSMIGQDKYDRAIPYIDSTKSLIETAAPIVEPYAISGVEQILKAKKMKEDLERKGALLGAGLVYKGVSSIGQDKYDKGERAVGFAKDTTKVIETLAPYASDALDYKQDIEKKALFGLYKISKAKTDFERDAALKMAGLGYSALEAKHKFEKKLFSPISGAIDAKHKFEMKGLDYGLKAAGYKTKFEKDAALTMTGLGYGVVKAKHKLERKGLDYGLKAADYKSKFERDAIIKMAGLTYGVVKAKDKFEKKGFDYALKVADYKTQADKKVAEGALKIASIYAEDKKRKIVQGVGIAAYAGDKLIKFEKEMIQDWSKKRKEAWLNKEVVTGFDIELGQPITVKRKDLVSKDLTDPAAKALLTKDQLRELGWRHSSVPREEATVGILPGNWKRRTDAFTAFGYGPEIDEILHKKKKAKELGKEYQGSVEGFNHYATILNANSEKFKSGLDEIDKRYKPVMEGIVDEDYTDKEYDKFIKITEERNEYIKDWIPKLESDEKMVDKYTTELEGLGKNVIERDPVTGVVTNINEPTITIGAVIPWRGKKIEIVKPVSWANDKTIIEFTKGVTTATLGRATGEFFNPESVTVLPKTAPKYPYSGTTMWNPVPQISAPTKPIISNVQLGKVFEVTYSIAPYFVPVVGTHLFKAEVAGKILEPSITKGRYGGPTSSWGYVKKHPVEVGIAATIGGAEVYSKVFKPTIYGVGTKLPTGKPYDKAFYKSNKHLVSKGEESFITSPWREFWRTKVGIKSIKPYYRASDYAKLSKTNPKKLQHIIDAMRGKRAVYNPARYIYGKYPKGSLSKTKTYSFLKKDTTPQFLGKKLSPESYKALGLDPTKYVSHAVKYKSTYKTDIRFHRDIVKGSKIKDIDGKTFDLFVSKPQPIQGIGRTFEPSSILSKSKPISTRQGVWTHTPLFTQFPKKSIKFYQTTKDIPYFMRGTKVISPEKIYTIETGVTNIIRSLESIDKKGKPIYKYYSETTKSSQPYLGGKLKTIRGGRQYIEGGKKLFPQTQVQYTNLDGTKVTNIATVRRLSKIRSAPSYDPYFKELNKPYRNIDMSQVKSSLKNIRSHDILKAGKKHRIIHENIRDVDSVYSKPITSKYTDYRAFEKDIKHLGVSKPGGPFVRSTERTTITEAKIKQARDYVRVIQRGVRQMGGVVQQGKIFKIAPDPNTLKITRISKPWGDVSKPVSKTQDQLDDAYSMWSKSWGKISKAKAKPYDWQEAYIQRIKAEDKLWAQNRLSKKAVKISKAKKAVKIIKTKVKPYDWEEAYIQQVKAEDKLWAQNKLSKSWGKKAALRPSLITQPQPQVSTQPQITFQPQPQISTQPISSFDSSTITKQLIVSPQPLVTSIPTRFVSPALSPIIKTSLLGTSLLSTAPALLDTVTPTTLEWVKVSTTQIPITSTALAPQLKTEVISKQAQATTTTTGSLEPVEPIVDPIVDPIIDPVVIKPPVIKPPKTIIPIIPIPFILDGKKKKKKKKPIPVPKGSGYDVFVKSKKQFHKANINPIKKNKAKDLGSYVTDTTLSATYKIKRTNKDALKPKIKVPKGYNVKTKHKFRDYKIVKGKRKMLNSTWIEKRNKRLDTPGEVKKVTSLAKIKKMQTPFKKKSKRKATTKFKRVKFI